MKRSMLLSLLLPAILFGSILPGLLQAGTGEMQKKKERTITVSVPQMQCGMCEERIEKALKKIDGVVSVEADAEADTVVVTYNPEKTSRKSIEREIADLGYDAGEKKAKAEAQAKLPGCCKPGGHE